MTSSLSWDVTQRRLVVTDVSEQLIGPIFEEPLKTICQSRLQRNLEDATDRLYRNVGNYQCTMSNNPEEQRSQPETLPHILSLTSSDSHTHEQSF